MPEAVSPTPVQTGTDLVTLQGYRSDMHISVTCQTWLTLIAGIRLNT